MARQLARTIRPLVRHKRVALGHIDARRSQVPLEPLAQRHRGRLHRIVKVDVPPARSDDGGTNHRVRQRLVVAVRNDAAARIPYFQLGELQQAFGGGELIQAGAHPPAVVQVARVGVAA